MEEPTNGTGAVSGILGFLSWLAAAAAAALVIHVQVPRFLDVVINRNVALPGATEMVVDVALLLRSGAGLIASASAFLIWAAIAAAFRRREAVRAIGIILSTGLFAAAFLSLVALLLPLADMAASR